MVPTLPTRLGMSMVRPCTFCTLPVGRNHNPRAHHRPARAGIHTRVDGTVVRWHHTRHRTRRTRPMDRGRTLMRCRPRTPPSRHCHLRNRDSQGRHRDRVARGNVFQCRRRHRTGPTLPSRLDMFLAMEVDILKGRILGSGLYTCRHIRDTRPGRIGHAS